MKKSLGAQEQAEILDKIKTAFNNHRKKSPGKKAFRYSTQLKNMTNAAISEGIKAENIASAAGISADCMRRWRRDRRKVDLSEPVKTFDVIPIHSNETDLTGDYLLRLEGNGFKIELIARKGVV